MTPRLLASSGFDGNASFETPPLAAPQDEASPHGEEAEGRLEPWKWRFHLKRTDPKSAFVSFTGSAIATAHYLAAATNSISTCAPPGSAATATVVRAGRGASKNVS